MIKKTFHYLFAGILILVIWQLLSRWLMKAFFPGPVGTICEFLRLLRSGELMKHMLASAYRIFCGTILGLIASFPVGFLLGCSTRADSYLGRVFNILYPIPKVVFLPIIVVCMGIGDEPKIFLIALVIFFQLTLTIRDAVTHISIELVKSMNALNPSKLQYLIHLVIPACMPEIFSGLRSTIGVSTALLFITENFASITGLGYFITKSMDSRDFDEMYGGILALAMLGVVLYLWIKALECYLCRWKFVETGNEKERQS